jgi:alkylation response protein AidB-like acyl-CoA dehydrogenase
MSASRDMNALSGEAFRSEIRTWIEQNYPPELRYPPKRLHLRDNWPWYKALSDKGWIAPGWPREHGGMGLSAEKQVIWTEELERHGCARLNDHGLTMLGPLLIRYGTDAQKQRFLPRILSGEDIWCQGYSEPGAGSDLAALRTRAERDGGEWVVNGQKIWTTMANDANWIFLLVRTGTGGRRQEGISFLLVPMDAPGVTVRPILNLEMHDEFCEVFFDDVRVPADHLVGEVDQGWAMAKALLGFERLFLGSPRQAAYALARFADLGRHLGIEDDPVFRDTLSRHLLDLENHKLLFASFLRAISRGRPVGAEMSLLKISQSELFRRITDDMIAIAGPQAGHVMPLDGDRLNPSAQFLQARPATIYGGSSEIQRNIIAKAVLGLPS